MKFSQMPVIPEIQAYGDSQKCNQKEKQCSSARKISYRDREKLE